LLSLLLAFADVAVLVVIPRGSAGALAVARSLYPNQRIVISTQAAHAFVSSAAEKSASLPELSPKQLILLPLPLPFCLSFRSAAEESAFSLAVARSLYQTKESSFRPKLLMPL
jgi:hypothetical protein